MLDILLSQLGIKPAELQETVRFVTRNATEANARLKRIEEKLGITEPLVLPGDEHDGR